MKINVSDQKTSHRVLQRSSGRIRPFVLALIILLAGLLLDKWWWQIGVVIIVVLFVEAFYRYRTLD
jgi:hypothetical protein